MDALVEKLSREVQELILRRRMVIDEDGLVARIRIHEEQLMLQGRSEDVGEVALFRDLRAILEFLASHLPTSITGPLSQTLMPALISLLEEFWLEPAIPLAISETAIFTSTLQHASALADQIERYRWHGADEPSRRV